MECTESVFIEEGACETVIADDVVAEEVVQNENCSQEEEEENLQTVSKIYILRNNFHVKMQR